jgi:GDP-4-dehydro-6-deoxy-D-mannose reductase
MRVLVTGVAGFAGSYLAEHLLDRGDTVLGCTLDGGWRRENAGRHEMDLAVLDRLADAIPLFSWDVSRPASKGVVRAVQDFKPTHLCHLAALSALVDCGDAEPTDMAWAVNVEGTRHVAELAAALETKPRMLFASSAQVYAPPENLDRPARTEQSLVMPRSAYGKTKRAAELAIAEVAEKRELNIVIARSFNHTGPRQSARFLLPEWTEQLVRGDDPIRIRCENTVLDLCDVRDVVRAYRLLLQNGVSGRIYNVGGGKALWGGDILEMLFRLSSRTVGVQQTQPSDRPRHNPIADISLIAADIAWRPQIPFETTVADTLAFWQRQSR